jgi:hypothetical protein
MIQRRNGGSDLLPVGPVIFGRHKNRPSERAECGFLSLLPVRNIFDTNSTNRAATHNCRHSACRNSTFWQSEWL